MGYPISTGITRNTDACKHCYLPNNEQVHWHKSYLLVGLSTVSYELLYLGDGDKSKITILIPPNLPTR